VAKVVGFVEAPALGWTCARCTRHRLSAARLAGAAQDPGGRHRDVLRDRAAHRRAESRARRRQACASNAIAVAIPATGRAHDGSLSGYRWGVERKRALLDREARS